MKNQNTIHSFFFWISKPEHWEVSREGAQVLSSMATVAAFILAFTAIIYL